MPGSRIFQLPPRAKGSSPSAAAQRANPGYPSLGGGIVAGLLAPHPPHLIYAENPDNNEPRSNGGWEALRWGYEALRKRMRTELKPQVILVHAPHWITAVGHHVNVVPRITGVSVDPIFPHLFRYHYDFQNDVDLAKRIVSEGEKLGLTMAAMRNPGLRVDYATIAAIHLLNPEWDVPIVSISSNNNPYFYSDAALGEMETLGRATRRAIDGLGRRAVLAASNSLSHLHWDVEPDIPEDMSKEHAYNDHQYRWDMRFIDIARSQPTSVLREFIPQHIEATEAEIKAGGLSWMLAAMNWPKTTGHVYAYGTVIGTGNAIIEWSPEP